MKVKKNVKGSEQREKEPDVLMGDVRVRPDVRIFTCPNEWRRGVTSGRKVGEGGVRRTDILLLLFLAS